MRTRAEIQEEIAEAQKALQFVTTGFQGYDMRLAEQTIRDRLKGLEEVLREVNDPPVKATRWIVFKVEVVAEEGNDPDDICYQSFACCDQEGGALLNSEVVAVSDRPL